jgi:hypothetical protein
MKYLGGCHCGAVRFEVEAPETIQATVCNCSIYSKSGYLHYVVDAKDLKLLQGKEHITTYTFGTATAQHHFCKLCGIKSFYVPRSHPQGFSVNIRCLDHPPTFTTKTFDGQHWEENIHTL